MKKVLLAVAVVIALLLAGGSVITWRAMSRDERLLPAYASAAKKAPSTASATPSHEPARAPAAIRTFSPSTLPSPGLPLVQTYAQLSREFAMGNSYAACRLAHDVGRCADLSRRKGSFGKFLKSERREGPRGALAEEILRKQIESDEILCSGFEGKADHAAWEYLYAAAQMGHLPSMARFAIAPPLDPLDFGSAIEGWLVYRSSAPSMFEAASDAGFRSAVVQRALEHSGGLVMDEVHLGGMRLVPVDYALAAKYAYAARAFEVPASRTTIPLTEVILAKLAEIMTPEQLEGAKAAADKLVASWPPGRLRITDGYVPGQTLPKAGIDCFEP